MVTNATNSRRTSARLLSYVAAAFVGLLLLAGTAAANATSSSIYQACIDSESLSGFSKSSLQSALSGVPSDLDEYYDCSGQIKAAIAGKSDKSGGGPTAQVKSAGGKYGSDDDKYAGLSSSERKAAIARDKRKSAARDTDAAVRRAATTPLAASAGAATPVWLIIGIGGLVLLLALELLRRTNLADRLPGRRSSATPRGDA